MELIDCNARRGRLCLCSSWKGNVLSLFSCFLRGDKAVLVCTSVHWVITVPFTSPGNYSLLVYLHTHFQSDSIHLDFSSVSPCVNGIQRTKCFWLRIWWGEHLPSGAVTQQKWQAPSMWILLKSRTNPNKIAYIYSTLCDMNCIQ